MRTFFPHYEEEQVTVWPYPVTTIKYYTFDGMHITVKRGSDLRYILTDHPSTSSGHHLGSTSGQTDVYGNSVNGRDERFYAGVYPESIEGGVCAPATRPS
jgi:hypothetical protein